MTTIASATLLFLAALTFEGAPAAAKGLEIVGPASVIDGDTIEIRNQRIRLHGIDAPESAQLCKTEGQSYRCGQRAANALADLLGRRTIYCRQKDQDRYGRIVAVCHVGDQNVNAWLVEQGHAIAYRQYSTDFVGQENLAREERAGIWSGTFDAPADYRRSIRSSAEAPSASNAPTDCKIKGNINGSGQRIYHVPGDAFYVRTQIDLKSGERWFCNEAEAQAAGWRPAAR